MNELEKVILIATNDRVETFILTDNRERNSQMLKSICGKMKNGSCVAFDREYYGPYRLFDFVGDVNNKFPDLIDLDEVYNHVEQYWEWYKETYKVSIEELAKRCSKKK